MILIGLHKEGDIFLLGTYSYKFVTAISSPICELKLFGPSCFLFLQFFSLCVLVQDSILFSNMNFFCCLSLQEEFPANTNILYVDLPSAELIGSSKNESSLPGMVLNIKKPITYVDQFGIQNWYNVITSVFPFLYYFLNIHL